MKFSTWLPTNLICIYGAAIAHRYLAQIREQVATPKIGGRRRAWIGIRTSA
jgi:hypothetical protein